MVVLFRESSMCGVVVFKPLRCARFAFTGDIEHISEWFQKHLDVEVSSLSPSPLRFSLSSVCHLLLSAWLSDFWCWFFPATPPSLGLELARSRKRSLSCLWLREMRADVPVWAWFLHSAEVCVLIEGRFLCTFQTLTLCVCLCLFYSMSHQVWALSAADWEPHWTGSRRASLIW